MIRALLVAVLLAGCGGSQGGRFADSTRATSWWQPSRKQQFPRAGPVERHSATSIGRGSANSTARCRSKG